MKFFKRKKVTDRRSNLGRAPNQKVISYYTASRRQLDSFERNTNALQNDIVRQGRVNKIRNNWFGIMIALIILVAIAYLSTLGTSPHVIISGPFYRNNSDYQTVIAKAFGNDLRNRFKPTLMTNDLRAKILKAVPEAQSISVNSSFLGHRPEVKLVNSEAIAIFAQTNKNNLILSNRGRLLLPANQSNINIKELPKVINNTGLTGDEGKQFMRPDEVEALGKLIEQYKADGMINVEYSLTKIPHELTAKEPGRGFYVRYLLDENIKSQYGAMLATINKLQQINQIPSEYIDARLADKVYFK